MLLQAYCLPIWIETIQEYFWNMLSKLELQIM